MAPILCKYSGDARRFVDESVHRTRLIVSQHDFFGGENNERSVAQNFAAVTIIIIKPAKRWDREWLEVNANRTQVIASTKRDVILARIVSQL